MVFIICRFRHVYAVSRCQGEKMRIQPLISRQLDIYDLPIRTSAGSLAMLIHADTYTKD